MSRVWETKKLGEVIVENKKSTIKSKGNKEGEYPFFVSGKTVKTINQSIITGSNIYLPTGGNFYVHYYSGDATYSTDTWSIRTIDDIEIKYLYYFLLLNEDIIGKKYFKGATIKHLQKNDFRAIELPLLPLTEQKRVVAILDKTFEAISKAKANYEQNLQNAKEILEGYLQSIAESKGDGWEEKSLAELCDINHGFAFLGKFFSNKGEYVLLTPGNFYEGGGFRDRGDKQKYYVGDVPRGYVLNKGDLLVAMTEQAAGLLGSPILVPESDKYLHNQRLGLVVPKPNVEIENEFFYHVFNYKSVRKSLHDSGTGVKVRHTSPTKIGQIKINYPKLKTERREIVQRIDALSTQTNKLEAIYKQKLSDLDELKKSILQKAFAGELNTAEGVLV